MSIDNFNDIHSTNGIGLHEKKLNGEIPVTREELLELIKSWGEIYIDNKSVINVGRCYDLSRLDVSQITDMSYIFSYSGFNGDVSNWNTSNVTNMQGMFYNTKLFNQELNFDTSKVTNMKNMFYGANKFNQPVNFDTSNVTDMYGMFCNARVFNQPLNFDTSNVTNMEWMFYDAITFNQNINTWNTSNVTNMNWMFYSAEAFQDKYNSGKELPYHTNEIKDWINNNRDKMNAIDIKDKHGDEIDGFFSNINDIHFTNGIGLHNNIHSLPISIP